MCIIGTILREGIIASITGGFFLEPSQGYFVNIVHSGLWLFFIILPMAIALNIPNSFIAWAVYCFSVVLVVCTILYLTYILHKTFDESEPISQIPIASENECNTDSDARKKNSNMACGSELSLDFHYQRNFSTVNPSDENLDAQCRRIGLDGLRLANILSPSTESARDQIDFSKRLLNFSENNVDLQRNSESFQPPCLLYPSFHEQESLSTSFAQNMLPNASQDYPSSLDSLMPTFSKRMFHSIFSNRNRDSRTTSSHDGALSTKMSLNKLSSDKSNSVSFHSIEENRSCSKTLGNNHRIVDATPSSGASLLFNTDAELQKSSHLRPDTLDNCSILWLRRGSFISPLSNNDSSYKASASQNGNSFAFHTFCKNSAGETKDVLKINRTSQSVPPSSSYRTQIPTNGHIRIYRSQSICCPSTSSSGKFCSLKSSNVFDKPLFFTSSTSRTMKIASNPSINCSDSSKSTLSPLRCEHKALSLMHPSSCVWMRQTRSSRKFYERARNRHNQSYGYLRRPDSVFDWRRAYKKCVGNSVESASSTTENLHDNLQVPSTREICVQDPGAISKTSSSHSGLQASLQFKACTSVSRETESSFDNTDGDKHEISPGSEFFRTPFLPGSTIYNVNYTSLSIQPVCGVSIEKCSSEIKEALQNPDNITASSSNSELLQQSTFAVPKKKCIPFIADDTAPSSHLISLPEIVPMSSRIPKILSASSSASDNSSALLRSNNRPRWHFRRRAVYIPTPSPPVSDDSADVIISSENNSALENGERLDKASTSNDGNYPSNVEIVSPSRILHRRLLHSRLALPVFPPNLNSLDHAYSSPIRNDLIPKRKSIKRNKYIKRYRKIDSDAHMGLIISELIALDPSTRENSNRLPQQCPSNRISNDLQQSFSSPSIIKTPNSRPLSPTPPFLSSSNRDDNEDAIEYLIDQPLPSDVGDDNVELNAPLSGEFASALQRQSRGVFSSSQHIRRQSSVKRVRRANTAYRLRLFSCIPHSFIIRFDRLQLSSLFDRKTTSLEVVFTVFLTALVSVVGSLMLGTGLFNNFSLVCLCFVISGCHFSLVKSVQPDPASPRHGFNRLIIYSRSCLFCLLGVFFILNFMMTPVKFSSNTIYQDTVLSTAEQEKPTISSVCGTDFFFTNPSSASWLHKLPKDSEIERYNLVLYGWRIGLVKISCCLIDLCGCLILAFPLVFLFGLVPQSDTFATHFLEQLDIHCFGGTGTANLLSVLFSLFRNILCIAISFAIYYPGSKVDNPQDIRFSIFWGFFLSCCFFISRLPNDIAIYKLAWKFLYTSFQEWKKIDKQRRTLFRKVPRSFRTIFSQKWTGGPKIDGDNVLHNSNDFDFRLKDSDRKISDFTTEDLQLGVLYGLQNLDRNTLLRRSQPSVCKDEKINDFDYDVRDTLASKRDDDGDQFQPHVTSGVRNDSECHKSMFTLPQSSYFSGELSNENKIPHVKSDGETIVASSGPLSLWDCGSSDSNDPLPRRIISSMTARQNHDFFVCLILMILGFAVHVSTVFTVPSLQTFLPKILIWLSIVWGFSLHYLLPQLMKPYPWLLFARAAFVPLADGKLSSVEIVFLWCNWIEKYFLIPAVTMATATESLSALCLKFGRVSGFLILLVASMKMLRNGYNGASQTYLYIFFTEVLFTHDFRGLSESFPIDYFFVSIFIAKISELMDKLRFIYIYMAPFLVSWGSCFHAIAQLGSIPHFMFILGNCAFSTFFSAPLEPFVASVIFISSYARPIRFWEATQKIHRIESTTTCLVSQLHGVSFEQVTANLNAIFYEHLARSLQKRLAGDIALGRWSGGTIQHGDVFILASDELHFLIHIIEIGNGLVTFQMRGLEFAGTSCHERESNGLNDAHQLDRGFCCCKVKSPSFLLSLNSVLRMRWLAWDFVQIPYPIQGYQLIDHSAATSLQLTDFRKLVLALFIQCLLYFSVLMPNLTNRLTALSAVLTSKFGDEDKFDLDPIFSRTFDDDFDDRVSGVTRTKFVQVYGDWIRYCLERCPHRLNLDSSENSLLMTFCFAISLLSRRALGGNPGQPNNALDSFLHYLYDIFKGDVHIALKDDWIFSDVEIIQSVIVPSIRIALKLYQDHFTWNPLSTNAEIYTAIQTTLKDVVICHETDPQWRSAVLNDAEKLFSFRRIDSGTTQQCYRFIMMNKQTLSFQVIKLNAECVRGFWAAQQREQIFLRNKNTERGSIQYAKHVLRNLINSSCDQPIGYPIYVSPLITSFVESHPEYGRIAFPSLSIPSVICSFGRLRDRAKLYCHRSCNLNSEIQLQNLANARSNLLGRRNFCSGHTCAFPESMDGGRCSKDSCASSGYKASGLAAWCAEIPIFPSNSSSQTPCYTAGFSGISLQNQNRTPSTTLAVLVHRSRDDLSPSSSSEPKLSCVRIIDPTQILDNLIFKLAWPSSSLMARCSPRSVCPLAKLTGVEGHLVHRWTPSNFDQRARSLCHRTIGLVMIPENSPILAGRCVAIWEDLGLEVCKLRIDCFDESCVSVDHKYFSDYACK